MNDDDQYEDFVWTFFYFRSNDMYGWMLALLALAASLLQTKANPLGTALVAVTNLLWAIYALQVGSHEEALLFFGLCVLATLRFQPRWKTRRKCSHYDQR